MYDDRPSPWAPAAAVVLAAAATWILTSGLARFWQMESQGSVTLAILAGIAVACARWPFLYGGLGAAAAAIVRWVPEADRALYLDASVWYTDLLLGYWPLPGGAFAWVALTLCALGVGALLTLEPLRTGSARWSLAVGTAVLANLWIWGDDRATGDYARFLLLTLALWPAGHLAFREDRWHRVGRRVATAANLPSSVLMALLIGLAAWALPAPESTVDLGPVSAWMRATFPALAEARGGSGAGTGEEFGFSLTAAGFARRLSELGGPVELDARPALTVRFSEPMPDTTIYLRGTAMTRYSGRGWVRETEAGETGPDSPPLGQELSLEIAPLLLATTTLFYPRELLEVHGVEFRFGQESHLLSTRRAEAPYRVVSALPAGRPGPGGRDTYDEHPGRYVALPPSLPGRVRELALQVAGARDLYGQALAIEEYLRELPYSLEVPATPPGRDFVDYFLFDLRRGYCTYSATAMVVMLRSLGIASRWVQGFAAEPPAEPDVTVLLSDAHAWVEAYFPGYGWAAFDPTPRFPLPPRAESGPGSAPSPAVPAAAPADPESLQARAGAELGPPMSPNHMPLWGIAAAVLAFAWIATSLRAHFRLRVDWSNERAAALRLYGILESLMALCGLGRNPAQTPGEHARHVQEAWPEVGRPLEAAAHDVAAAQFAPPGAPLPAGARRRLTGLLATLLVQAERRLGRIRSAWIRFRFYWW